MARQRINSLSLTPPLSSREMERLRLQLRAKPPSGALGVHQHRRMGQSLEFREFRPYEPGCDIRSVDWSASARQGFDGTPRGAEYLKVRSFEAEARHTVIVVLDMRPAMRLPEAAPKMLIGYWIAACLIQAAQAERDRIVFFPIFTDRGVAPIKIDRPSDTARAHAVTLRMLNRSLSEDEWGRVSEADVAPLFPMLAPTSAVVLISDMLFDDHLGHVAELARRAQRGYRSFHVVEIDSWPHEAAILREQPFSLGALEGRNFDGGRFGANPEFIAATESAIGVRLDRRRASVQGPGLVWPDRPLRFPDTCELSSDGVAAWFREHFPRTAFLPSLLSRAAQ